MDGDGGGYTYANPDSDRDDCILQGIGKRDGSQCIGTQPGYIDTVYYIIEGLDQHGQHHWDGHGDEQRKHRFRPHK